MSFNLKRILIIHRVSALATAQPARARGERSAKVFNKRTTKCSSPNYFCERKCKVTSEVRVTRITRVITTRMSETEHRYSPMDRASVEEEPAPARSDECRGGRPGIC
ncbi:hypothetical protein EVAR_66776_1 [Eumeta japonica]|uniref:Secreted protein n=1 Tax=Eumeta variegata TaxID=151549 RepID=A0A4C1ZU75_EUMVA|nr:hypothetical protein EVAR_66776_1 [Eumeta japonica]